MIIFSSSFIPLLPNSRKQRKKVKSLSHVQHMTLMDCSLPGSSVHGISQARILEWAAISFSRGIFPTQGLN